MGRDERRLDLAYAMGKLAGGASLVRFEEIDESLNGFILTTLTDNVALYWQEKPSLELKTVVRVGSELSIRHQLALLEQAIAMFVSEQKTKTT